MWHVLRVAGGLDVLVVGEGFSFFKKCEKSVWRYVLHVAGGRDVLVIGEEFLF